MRSKRRQFSAAKLVRALSLFERARLSNEYQVNRAPARQIAEVKKTIKRWRQKRPYDNYKSFLDYLLIFGVEEESVVGAFKLPPSRLLRNNGALVDLFKRLDSLNRKSEPSDDYDSNDARDIGFLNLVYPLIDICVENILNSLSEFYSESQLFCRDTIRRQCYTDIEREILNIIEKTCLWELRIARLQGSLRGQDGKGRYRDFIRQLASPVRRKKFFIQYPVLLSCVIQRLDMYERNTRCMLRRLMADHNLVCDHFFSGSISPLKGWNIGLGDSHAGGQSVVSLEFLSGDKLMYKPRPLAVDAGFQEIISWSNVKLGAPVLRSAHVVDRGVYGWCEFVRHEEAKSTEDIELFFHRHGRFLALFYALRASDMHHENVICCGADPVYVDLETLFHAQLPGYERKHPLIMYRWPTTVADTYIIDGRGAERDTGSKPDLSALGAYEGQAYQGRAFAMVDAGTDLARLEETNSEWHIDSTHLPRLNGKSVDAGKYARHVIAGFNEMYDVLLENKSFLIGEHGLSAWFSEARVRLIARPTELYMTLIQRSLHPDFMVDAIERELFLGQIFDKGKHISARWMNGLIDAELEDMKNLDVPIFHQRFGDCKIYDARDRVLKTNGLSSPYERVAEHVSSLSATDRNAQCRLIRDVLKIKDGVKKNGKNSDLGDIFSRSINRSRFVDAAVIIGEQLASEAIHRGEDSYWICKPATPDGNVFSGGAMSLYDGVLGISLFMGVLGAVNGSSKFWNLAISSLNSVLRWSDGGRVGFETMGVFTGVYGIPYVLACLSSVGEDRQLMDEAIRHIEEIDLNHYADECDIIGGSPGAIIFLCSLLRDDYILKYYRDVIIEKVEMFANSLRVSAVSSELGVGWCGNPSYPLMRPLTGFAHGNAGISAALYAASRVLNDSGYALLADKAIAYENSHRTPNGRGWLDLRVNPRLGKRESTGVHSMCAWCHGAAGVAMGRLISLSYLDDGMHERALQLANDIRVAFDDMLHFFSNGEYDNVCLCHGLLGNLEILRDVSDNIGIGIPSLSLDGNLGSVWRCGDDAGTPVTDEGADPGLMTGRAGVGYGLLLHALPEKLPSIISLRYNCNM